MESNVFLLLGTNVGSRLSNLKNAKIMIDTKVADVVAQSKIYETAAWGKTDQNSFLNQVLKVKTNAIPSELLNILLQIEIDLGRIRKEKWGPRLIDIDILLYNQTIISTSSLKVPHPEIPNRRFTLVPLVELAPDFIHPGLKISLKELLKYCIDPLEVSEFKQ